MQFSYKYYLWSTQIVFVTSKTIIKFCLQPSYYYEKYRNSNPVKNIFSQFFQSDKNIKAAEEKLKKLEAEYKKEKTDSETKKTELETNLQVVYKNNFV